MFASKGRALIRLGLNLGGGLFESGRVIDVLPDNFNDSQTSIGITEKDETLENIDTTHEQGNNGENGMTVISEREETKLENSGRANQIVTEENEEPSGKRSQNYGYKGILATCALRERCIEKKVKITLKDP